MTKLTQFSAQRVGTEGAFTLLEMLLVLALIVVILGGLASLIRVFSNSYLADERRVSGAQLARSISQMLSDDLVAAVRTVASGGTVLAETSSEKSTSLSDNHHTILTLVAKGFSNHDIARFLGLSENTIKKHLSVIYRKLGVANRAEAVALALREGFIHQ